MLCFHIGLPKTATTFLQWEVLPRLPETMILHKGQGPELSRKYLKEMTGHCRRGRRRIWPKRFWLGRGIRRRLRAPGSVVITNENISMGVNAVWTGEGPGTVARRLAADAADLGVPASQVRILFGLRAQAPWLASRYAESAKDNPDFDQAGFARHITAIADGTARAAPLDWLDYAHVYDALADVFGPQNLLFLPLEAVEQMNAAECAGRIAAFLALPQAPQAPAALPEAARRNVSARAEGGWRLKSGNGHIELTPAMESAIAARFAATNAGLRDRTGIALP